MSLTFEVLQSEVQLVSLRMWHISFSVLAIWLLRVLLRCKRLGERKRRIQRFSRANNCAPASPLPKPFLGPIRHKLSLLLNPGGDLLDHMFFEKYLRYGDTHALHDKFGVPVVVHTVDPVNINAILVKSADDWGPAKSRARTMYPLAQDGLLNSEGEQWHKNRKLMLRHIHHKRAKDVRYAEPHIQLLFDAMGPVDKEGWTGVINLLDLFHRLSLDMSTEFLLGTSANSQANGIYAARMQAAMQEFDLVRSKKSLKQDYDHAYEVVRIYMSMRSKLGSKYWLADGPKYRKACETLNAFTDELIERAIERSSSPDDVETNGRYGLIDSLVQEIGNPIHIRNLLMDLAIAGQEMSGTMAAWIFAQLEANPNIFDRVRDEVLERLGTEQEPRAPLTWDNLRSCTQMQHVILETLRMYPLLANIGRNAKRDTVLPRGGGPDGTQPIAVPKGAAVTCNIYLVHRREQDWGEDSWEFKPDRWNDRKLNASYAPFGMGPRVCIGQHLSMTEISFLIARIMQHFAEIRAPEGQDNLTKGYRVVIAPMHGVQVRLRRAS